MAALIYKFIWGLHWFPTSLDIIDNSWEIKHIYKKTQPPKQTKTTTKKIYECIRLKIYYTTWQNLVILPGVNTVLLKVLLKTSGIILQLLISFMILSSSPCTVRIWRGHLKSKNLASENYIAADSATVDVFTN